MVHGPASFGQRPLLHNPHVIAWCSRCSSEARTQPSKLTAFAMTKVRIASDRIDWEAMQYFAQWAIGMTSVGLNASEFVSPRYR